MQSDYLALPWVMLIMRWDGVNSSADPINGFTFDNSTPFFAPLRSTRNRYTPGVQFLIHPNIKASFEYQFRPQQYAAVATNASGTLQNRGESISGEHGTVWSGVRVLKKQQKED